ncbi:hypothetical protein AGOR_G00097200 [Albula goreensis]|uniref:ERCC4 domain-containing protein n=1 Tax=Albula goreensis TaxID=1534307 RepID=A0A8T3DQZ8_9TELE|nr:hypothetical protein AGOR_G00097200 [Albula goreensis]
MGGSRLDAQHNEDSTSDLDDLPVYDFSQPTRSQAKPAEMVVLDSSDSESPAPQSRVSHLVACSAGAGGDQKAFTLSSDSEEEAFVPLALRLKQRLDNTVKPATVMCPVQPQFTPASISDTCMQPHLSKTSLNTAQVAQHNALLFLDPEEEKENSEGPKASLTEWDPVESCPWTEQPVSPPKKKVAKRSPTEIEAAREEALRKRRDRERLQVERELRRLEMERQKVEKKALTEAVKALRPEECLKHMVVSVDPALLQLDGGGALLTSLQALGCSCAIESQALPCSITWARRTPSTQTGDMQCIPESHTVIHLPVENFIAMVHSYTQAQKGHGFDYGPTLTAWTLRILAQSSGKTPSLAVIDLEKYFRSQRSQVQKKHRQAVLAEEHGTCAGAGKRRKRKEGQEQLPEVSRVEVEEALVDLQLHTGVQVRFLPSWKEFSDYITMSTKAVAEAPFKREREKTGFSFCLESEWAGGFKVDRGGKGLLQVWKRQIQQLNRVSPDIASAILAVYPSPQLLAQAYRRCKTEREKLSLLSDVLIRRGEGVTSTTRRVGPELSKRLYLLMMSSDHQQVLDSTAA